MGHRRKKKEKKKCTNHQNFLSGLFFFFFSFPKFFFSFNFHHSMGLTCFICGSEIEDERQSRLIRHAEQVHQGVDVDFTCYQPGCNGSHVGVVPAVVAVTHHCWHLSARNVTHGTLEEDSDDESEDEFGDDEGARQGYLQAEDEQNPRGALIDDWLLDNPGEGNAEQKFDFSAPPEEDDSGRDGAV